MKIRPFLDQRTHTWTYLVFDPTSRDAILIDPVRDFDPLRVSVGTAAIDLVAEVVAKERLNVRLILETHVHADHLSGAPLARAAFDAPVVIGSRITEVQRFFADVFGMSDLEPDGSAFDRLAHDGECLEAGTISVRALHTPGHTPACVSYLVGDLVFTGDALFLPDSGTGRCDFPGGSAAELFDAITTKLYVLPDSTRVFVGHDYGAGGARSIQCETSIGLSKEGNVRLSANTSREAFVTSRQERDATLSPPSLIFQSLQVNIRGGELPAPEDNGRRYLSLPMDVFG